jgi:hypothetical protein
VRKAFEEKEEDEYLLNREQGIGETWIDCNG